MAQNYGNFVAKTVVETAVNCPNNAWAALPTTTMSGRTYVRVFNKGEYKLYLSFDNSAVVQHRLAIADGEFTDYPINEYLTLYGRSGGAGSVRVIVQEFK